MRASSRRFRGYTLVELLVVLAVMGLLAGLAMPLAEMTVQRERERELRRALWEIRDAIDGYRQACEQGVIVQARKGPPYPASLKELTEAHEDQRASHQGELRRFLRRVPRDPFAEPGLPAEQTWGLRSYASDADKPQAGNEVYDVYSRATGTGLNGIPLSQW
ncbi:prepilin-type N-terminal cleavage/methylation domain-containing protein [Paucibacter sp. APW11]|uniref:Prepilin-type N-terminal cleavage/methylation domain-containing protein n=1 Tax=Roseateles aquae TaxID=3077235 RepID=A0ABU3P509_9BURK|nr:prepilin-type N-terminal cleavage/methylation domain-containing protein [Paucibacter sp. APW11]MDT8997654.1 prepilin-type N-terminal cleavage/methylation domain-containing protein [Paucibacter sp. APW11]